MADVEDICRKLKSMRRNLSRGERSSRPRRRNAPDHTHNPRHRNGLHPRLSDLHPRKSPKPRLALSRNNAVESEELRAQSQTDGERRLLQRSGAKRGLAGSQLWTLSSQTEFLRLRRGAESLTAGARRRFFGNTLFEADLTFGDFTQRRVLSRQFFE